MEQIKRNPEGLVKGSPIALRLMPQELLQARKLAAEHGVSCSKLARDAYLAGLPVAVEKMSPSSASSTPSQAESFPAGDQHPTPAGLSTLSA